MANWIRRTALTLRIAASLSLALPLVSGVAHAQDHHDEVALLQLQSLLMHDVARRAAAGQSEEGMQANQKLESMPRYAQKEILGIVMAIMEAQRKTASVHVDAFQTSGPEAAAMSFSPAVRARIQALSKRLAADENFKRD